MGVRSSFEAICYVNCLFLISELVWFQNPNLFGPIRVSEVVSSTARLSFEIFVSTSVASCDFDLLLSLKLDCIFRKVFLLDPFVCFWYSPFSLLTYVTIMWLFFLSWVQFVCLMLCTLLYAKFPSQNNP